MVPDARSRAGTGKNISLHSNSFAFLKMASKQRNIRKRRTLDEAEGASEEEEQGLSVEDTKLLQKQRQRKTVRRNQLPPPRPSPTQLCSSLRRCMLLCEQGIEASSLAVADKAPKLADAAAGAGPDVLEAAFKKEKRRTATEEDPLM